MIAPTRRTYHTALKDLIRMGFQVEKQYTATIDPSLLWRWKQESPRKYFGGELAALASEKEELIKEFVERENLQRIFQAYLKLVAVLISILSESKAVAKLLRSAKSKVVNAVLEAKESINIESCFRLFMISRSTFQNWLMEIRYKCDQSWFYICNRRRPNQLTRPEIRKMKELLESERFKSWPVVSVWHYASRNGLLHTSLQTWYKYRKLLGIRRPFALTIKKSRPVGIRVAEPNQLWHADVTFCQTADGLKHAVHFLMDNYSRKLLAWRIASSAQAKVTKANLIEAVRNELRERSTILLTDDGTENDNSIVRKFCKANGLYIQIAQKDIPQSNSMIEAFNKIFKKNYLRFHRPENRTELIRMLERVTQDYNHVRPHCSLNGLTPAEAHSGTPVPESPYKAVLQQAKQRRIELNRKNTCKGCR